MSFIEFPYVIHKGIHLPIIPFTIHDHNMWAFVDSGATFSVFHTQTAERLGLNIHKGRKQMIVVGDGSFIPVYIHNLSLQIDKYKINAPIGFSERLGIGFNLLGR
ncbi:MAG: retropepsin-like domain-containing protein, partial [Nitrospirae bacterium]|nr:retropepsin-like domain-containing protein [Nitrospirota bacterium]